MTPALISRDDSRLTVEFTAEALALKAQALERSALIGKVNDASTQEAAVAAQTEIANVLSLAEKARKACKEPILEFGRTIDDRARAFVGELKEEQLRLSKLVGDFQMLEQARVRAEQAAANTRLLELEREKAAAIQQATSHEELEAIQADFNDRAAAEKPVAPTRAEGQRVTEDWEITVSDIWLLAKSHPTCVKIQPMLSEIKMLLNAGVKVAGVKAEKKIKSGVRIGRPITAIEV